MSRRLFPDLKTLIALFYTSPEQLGRFTEVTATAMPPDFARLLAHEHHMTVTVEAFHRSKVDVRVLERRRDGQHYARKILLTRQSDGKVVQYGIMRVNFDVLAEEVRQKIESESIPLGRILIEHNVLREIHLRCLWKVEPGPELQQLFDQPTPTPVYGRTALIDCDGEPAIELLEIVTLVDQSW